MKQATGELNMTVIVVIIIALLSFFFFNILWPQISGNFAKKTKCDEAICECPERDNNGKCKVPDNNALVKCTYKDKKGQAHDIMCTWKG